MRKVKVATEMCTYYKGLRKVIAIYVPAKTEKYTAEIRAIFWTMPEDSKEDIINKSRKMIKDTLVKRNSINAEKPMPDL